MAVLISEWFHALQEKEKNKDSQWDCEVCDKNKLWTSRNCDGKGRKAQIKVLDEVFDRCPIAVLNREAFELVSIINQCEGGGFGGGRMSPGQFLEETAFYLNIRNTILNEQARIERWKEGKGNG